MEYEKHIKRLVLGYLRKECKNAYKAFLKYSFHQSKHISTRVAGQTLEDILRIYSRIEEIVQGRLEDTNYYKERSVEFSSPIHLDNQLLYLLDKVRPFTPASTPCPRSPAESSVVGSHHDNDVHTNVSDVETTPEHTLPGNISSHENDFLQKTPYRKEANSPVYTTPCVGKLPTSRRESVSEVTTLKISGKSDLQKKLASNMLNTPEIPCFSSHRSENEKNKEGVGTELDIIFHDFLGTPMVNTINKAVSAESTTSASSSSVTHSTTASGNWQQIDEHNNRAVSSILAANAPNSKPANVITTTSDNVVYNDNLATFQAPPVSSTLQMATTSSSLPSNQYLLPTSMGMYIVPQASTSTIPSGNQQQFYIVNPPVVLPQQPSVAPVMQLLQPLQPANKPVVIHQNHKAPLAKDGMHLSEQDIMSMPTIIINERNEITYADPVSLPSNTPGKTSEAHDIKEFINLYRASDQSPIVKLQPHKRSRKPRTPSLKPTPTIKVEIFQRDTLPPNVADATETAGTSDNPQINTGRVECTGLPNLNDIIETEPVERTEEEPVKEINMDCASEPESGSHDKAKLKIAGSICTPSPVKTNGRKPTPKSGSHVRNLTFPSPIRKTSEKPDSRRSSPRNINKQQATKDLFNGEREEEEKASTKGKKTRQSTKAAKSPPESKEKNAKQAKRAYSKSPRKPKLPKKQSKKEVIKKQDEEDTVSKCSWDTNLRKLTAPTEEKHSSPVKRASTKKKVRRSTELDAVEVDGKKLEDALKTPEQKVKAKSKTTRKKTVKTLKSKKLEEKKQSPEEEVCGETKILSPSKLNANKRNILSNDVDDITPNIFKESSQYPISSKIRRNISTLLETPIKEGLLPPTPGTAPDKTDTPFTPMLRANLKDFTEGDTFSINTPNFPVTPGLAAMVNSNAAYYILNDTESNKVTEATVLQEEKKSSVRKSDDDEVELSPRVYGSKEILESFNKSCVGKKNLELLDNRGVKWDGSSDKEDKSEENSENNSDEESNNTVIQNRKMEQPEEIVVSTKTRRSSGKCMATLHSQLLKEINNPPESLDQTAELKNQEDLNADPQNDEEDKGGGQITEDKPKANKTSKSGSSSSDSEVLSKKSYVQKKNSRMEIKLPVIEDEDKKGDKEDKSKLDKSNDIITGDKFGMTAQEVRQAISDVCVENTSDRRPISTPLKEQLEEKKKRLIELQKAQPSLGTPRTPSRRTILKQQPNLNAKSKRKHPTPRKVVQSEINPEEEGVPKESPDRKTKVRSEDHAVDSQDEFFKKSGTNLHRKNKEDVQTTKRSHDSQEEVDNNILDTAEMEHNSLVDDEDKKRSNQQGNNMEESQEGRRTLEEPVVEKSNKQSILLGQNESRKLNDPDEFEKSWEDCHVSLTESEPIVLTHDESQAPGKKLEDYNFSILQKKIALGLPCSDGSTFEVVLTVSSFDSLLDIKPSEECETTDGSRDETDSLLETSKRKPDVSDSENAECRTDDADDFKCAKKRKHRSDSCNSNSSTKRMKTSEILNNKNIEKILFKLHGPNKQEQV